MLSKEQKTPSKRPSNIRNREKNLFSCERVSERLKNNINSDPNFSPDINFNTWNLDLSYTWQFAPGSQLTALYRNQIFNQNSNSEASYLETLEELFKEKQRNTFSLRMVYFIDYNDLKKVFKSKTI